MKIGEVSKLYNISIDTLRYYERVEVIPTISRGKNGVREFSEGDLKWVEFVRCMREAGMEIEALIKYGKLYREGETTEDLRKNILIEQYKVLDDKRKKIETSLEKLDYKIKNYSKIMKLEGLDK